MISFLRKIFPLYRTFHRARPKHYRLFRSSHLPLLQDFPTTDIATLNAASEEYFQRTENEDYWRLKPFSDRQYAGWMLMRFGQLMAGLMPGPGSRVLDFGCGTGWTSVMLAQTGADVVGVDISPSALEIAKKNAQSTVLPANSSLSFETYDGTHLPFDDEAFDLVTIYDAFHHLPNQKRMLSELNRLLWKHGRLGFAEPGVGHAEAEHSGAEAHEHGVLEQDVDIEQLYRSALAAGFQHMDLFVPAIHPRTFSLPITRALWFIRGFSFLLPANVNRLSILTAPIGVIHKSPYLIHSMNPRDLRADISIATSSLHVNRDAEYQIEVKIHNPTETVWLKEGWRGIGYVRVGAHLCDSSGQMLQLDYGRSALNRDLCEKQNDVVLLNLKAPATAGQYIVQIDAVNEGICWFADRGSCVKKVSLSVSD
jgi:SAM-dependent methyltransferase